MENLSILASLALVCGALSFLSLLLLHFLSPEFKPSWRMVSEYALGKHKWLLSLFFTTWSLCTLLTAALLWNSVVSGWARFGMILLFVSGIGALMGGLFDIKHKLHGLSSILGIPTAAVAALLISYHLTETAPWDLHRGSVLFWAHSLWISLLLMAFSMMLFFSSYKKSGLPMGPDVEPPQTLPPGIIGLGGYANRILFVCYIGWLMWMAQVYLSL